MRKWVVKHNVNAHDMIQLILVMLTIGKDSNIVRVLIINKVWNMKSRIITLTERPVSALEII